MLKLRVPITEEELLALQTVAEQEMRDIGEQAHFIIHQELERLGLLKKDEITSTDLNYIQPHSLLSGKTP